MRRDMTRVVAAADDGTSAPPTADNVRQPGEFSRGRFVVQDLSQPLLRERLARGRVFGLAGRMMNLTCSSWLAPSQCRKHFGGAPFSQGTIHEPTTTFKQLNALVESDQQLRH